MLKLMENYIHSFDNEKFIKNYFINKNDELQGLTGAATSQIISKCVSLMDRSNVYLEVGIYQATNLVLVASENKNKLCFGVDNFSQEFIEDANYPSMTTEEVVNKRIKEFNVEKNCLIFKMDFRKFLNSSNILLKNKVEVYFFDGPHTLQDQLDGVEMAFPFLADEALIFVDDWASENVVEASKILLEKHKQNLKIVKILNSQYNVRKFFNQGQIVFKYTRNI